ncbi:MAG TPA: ROK family protein [Pyrinomonadaceae bacterium]|jgi:glucokinase
MSTEAIAGIDIGGTKIAVALSDTDGNVIARHRFATQVEIGPYRVVENAVKEIERMVKETATRLIAAGVGCGGPLDRQRGVVLSPPNLPDWDEFPIVELIEKRLGVRSVLDNDANAAALGESKYGAGRGLRNVVYITISTGIGGGIIIEGKILHGVKDGAGEVGHITVLPDGPRCGCGARGCMEAICSGTSIARRARERLLTGEQSSMTTMAGGIMEVTAKTVAEAMRGGDRLAAEVWDETVYYLAVGISNIINVISPEAVILGGGVSTAGEQLLEPLRRQVRDRNTMLPPEKINILQATLGGDSGVYGALILGRRAIALEGMAKAETLSPE